MEQIIAAAFAVGVALYLKYRFSDSRKQFSREKSEQVNNDEKPVMSTLTRRRNHVVEQGNGVQKNTLELLEEIFANIGAQSLIDDNGTWWIEYQGGYFVISANANSLIVYLYYTSWYDISSEDIDLFSAIRQAINEANKISMVNTVYTVNKEDASVRISSRCHVLISENLPNIEDYMRSVLIEFFNVRKIFVEELEKIKVRQNIN